MMKVKIYLCLIILQFTHSQIHAQDTICDFTIQQVDSMEEGASFARYGVKFDGLKKKDHKKVLDKDCVKFGHEYINSTEALREDFNEICQVGNYMLTEVIITKELDKIYIRFVYVERPKMKN